jgi:hypothetical protein
MKGENKMTVGACLDCKHRKMCTELAKLKKILHGKGICMDDVIVGIVSCKLKDEEGL